MDANQQVCECTCICSIFCVHGIIVSFIDLVPTSGAGVDSSSEESPVAYPALLPNLVRLFHVNMHVEFASCLVFNPIDASRRRMPLSAVDASRRQLHSRHTTSATVKDREAQLSVVFL